MPYTLERLEKGAPHWGRGLITECVRRLTHSFEPLWGESIHARSFSGPDFRNSSVKLPTQWDHQDPPVHHVQHPSIARTEGSDYAQSSHQRDGCSVQPRLCQSLTDHS